MKFCDKLPKLRKQANLSQEQLADKLKMSRQAISKWESGTSYPDMVTMIQICKALGCSLNDLIDDDVIGNNDTQKSFKININEWINDLLKFITKTYNMFCSMKFSEKIKCLFELGLIALILFLFFTVLGNIGSNLFYSMFEWLPNNIYYAIRHIFSFIYTIVTIAVSCIIFIHLFKIRYLDYFVTVEDGNIKQKNIEEPIDEIKNIKQDKFGNLIYENKKEKIIIRDPKHSAYSFFSALGKVITWCLKCFLALASLFFIFSFIAFVFEITCSLMLIKSGQLFLGFVLAGIGALTINYIILEMICKFIFNLKHNFKRLFIMFIAGLVFAGIGIAISALALNQFEIKQYNQLIEKDKLPQTIIKEIDYSNNLVLSFLNMDNINIIYDEKIDNIKVEVNCLSNYKFELYNYSDYFNNTTYTIYDYAYYQNSLDTYKAIFDGLKNKIIYEFDDVNEKNMILKVYISKNNYDKIIENNRILYENQQ